MCYNTVVIGRGYVMCIATSMVQCKMFGQPEEIQRQLEFLYPGEIILNASKDELNRMFEVTEDD